MSHSKRIATGNGKQYKWIVRSRPGPHPLNQSIPLLILVRDRLRLADNAREAKKIISDGVITVDGKVRKDPKYGIGLMDIIGLKQIEKYYRVMPSVNGMILTEISKKDASVKIVKITGKVKLAPDVIQLTLHDGTTLQSKSDDHKVNDTLLLTLPEKKIKTTLVFKKGTIGLVINGRHSGETGKINEILDGIKNRKSLTTIGELQTLTDYILIIGEDNALI